jgi:hypothetical protein
MSLTAMQANKHAILQKQTAILKRRWGGEKADGQ